MVLAQKYSVVYNLVLRNAGDGRGQAAAARASRVTIVIRANLTPRMPSSNGLGHRGGSVAFVARLQKIDRSYTIEKGPLS